MPEIPRFTIEDARLVYKNFAGRATPLNKEGDRNFAIVLTQEVADELAENGWNVKQRDPRDEGDEPMLFIPVKIGYKMNPPTVVVITNDGKTRTRLGQKSLDIIDFADIKTVDVVCQAYDWTFNEKSGRAAYLKTIVVTIDEDPLERKYGLIESVGEDPVED